MTLLRVRHKYCLKMNFRRKTLIKQHRFTQNREGNLCNRRPQDSVTALDLKNGLLAGVCSSQSLSELPAMAESDESQGIAKVDLYSEPF